MKEDTLTSPIGLSAKLKSAYIARKIQAPDWNVFLIIRLTRMHSGSKLDIIHRSLKQFEPNLTWPTPKNVTVEEHLRISTNKRDIYLDHSPIF